MNRPYRDSSAQKAVADWAESLTPAWFSACTNSASAWNAQDETNIGFYCLDKGYKRTSTIYHDNAQVYPDVSLFRYQKKIASCNFFLGNAAEV